MLDELESKSEETFGNEAEDCSIMTHELGGTRYEIANPRPTCLR